MPSPHRLERAFACVAAAAGVGVIGVAVGFTVARTSGSSHIVLPLAGNAMLSASFIAVGLLLTLRRPRLPIGWLLLLAGVIWSSGCLVVWPHHLVDSGRPVPTAAAVVASADSQWAWPLAVVPAIQLTLLLLPDGRLRSPRWRPVAVTALVAMVLTTCALAVEPVRLSGYGRLRNPLGVRGGENVSGLTVAVGAITLFAVAVVGVVGLVREFRRSTGVRRQQMRWIAAGGAAAVVGIASSIAAADDWSLLITTTGLSLVPVAIAVAVLRYRLYDLGRVISRTVSYAALTVTLLGVYVAIVAVAGLVAGRGSVGVAAGTLGAAAVFRPLRRRLQTAVDRRFNRARYDAAATVDAFAQRLRNAVDLDAVTNDLLRVVDGVIEPSRLSLWLPERG